MTTNATTTDIEVIDFDFDDEITDCYFPQDDGLEDTEAEVFAEGDGSWLLELLD